MRKAFPSMTPKPPGGVQSPSPSTRVESETMATVLPRLVSSKDSSLSSRIAVDTRETPGVYQTPNHWLPKTPQLGMMRVFPR